MDFFERQDKARKKTKLLVVYFAVAVLSIIASIYLAALVIFNGAQARHHRYYDDSQPQIVLWNPELLIGVALGTLAVIGCGTAFKTAQLASGGSVVAESLGGRLVMPNTTDPAERRLLNVVEEMSLASGVPTPQVYVMDGESGINAFAAGHTASDAVVSVTRGCLQTLNRDELQGVIGHEFSHILNGDMRLNLRLLGVIFGLLCIATIGRILLRTRGGSRDRNPLPLLGFVMLLLGWIGVFFGQLIQAAVSRQREFLADASSVQFTRNPAGLSGALQKIGGGEFGSRMESEHAADACHMFFGNGLGEPFFALMATHPPLEERIKAIDPYWAGKFKAARPVIEEKPEPPPGAQAGRFPFPPIMPGAQKGAGGNFISGAIAAGAALSNLGNPTPLHLRYAQELRESFSEPVKAAAREPRSAVALLYALLLSPDAAMRAKQLQEIEGHEGSTTRENVIALQAGIAAVAARARLPLVNLALPALRQLRPEEFQRFSDTLQWLIESDGQIELFEFALQKIVRRHLEPQFGRTHRAVVQFYSVKPLLPDCGVVLSALARVGSGDEGEVLRAVRNGAPYLRAQEGAIALSPRDACGLEQIDAALDRLAQAAPQIKKNLLEACVRVAGADGIIQEGEAELLRAIADTLDCPIPPFVTME